MITIIDYIGHSDNSGKPMGHSIKVINETLQLLLDITHVGIAVPKSHLSQVIEFDGKIVYLPYNICAFSTDKIGNLRKKWKNLRTLFSHDVDISYFINVDFSLFLYLALFERRSKYWIMFCYNPLKGVSGWREKVIRNVLNRAALIVVTSNNFCESIPGNTVFVPDYYYIEELYRPYGQAKQKDTMVCLGTMGETKKLEELIEVMNGTNIQLKIIGNFGANPERYSSLKDLAANNVIVEDRYVGNDDYYRLLSSAQYVVLPYDMDLYEERTSGILLECVFLNGIPIAPSRLLDFNSINGIGYESIEQIPGLIESKVLNKLIHEKNKIIVSTIFDKEKIARKLQRYC